MNRLQQRKFSGKLTHDVIQASFSAGETEIVETSLLILSNLGPKKTCSFRIKDFFKNGNVSYSSGILFQPKVGLKGNQIWINSLILVQSVIQCWLTQNQADEFVYRSWLVLNQK